MASLIKEEGRLFGLEVVMHAVGENVKHFSSYHSVSLKRICPALKDKLPV